MVFVLLLARHHRARPGSALLELGCCLYLTTLSSGFSTFVVRRTKRPRVFDPGGGQRFEVDPLSKSLLQVWDNKLKLIKGSGGTSSGGRQRKRQDSPTQDAGSHRRSTSGSRIDELLPLHSLCKEGQLDRALHLLGRLTKQQGVVVPVKVYAYLLKACSVNGTLAQARQLHAHLDQHEYLERNTFLGECVVSTLVRCGGLQDALLVFDRLPGRGVFAWTAVISGYMQRGLGREALSLYQRMQDEKVQPNAHTFVALIKACCAIAELDEGKRIHAEATRCGLGSDLFVGTNLVDMYGKCGSIPDAQRAFDGMSFRDVVAWTAMVTVCAQQGEAEAALDYYEQMLDDGASPNERTFVGALQACGLVFEDDSRNNGVGGEDFRLECLARGRNVHAEARRKGYDGSNAFVGSSILSMYGKMGSMVDAQIAFDALSEKNIVAWNAILACYVQQQSCESAPQRTLVAYQLMLEDGVSPNELTFVSVIRACGLLIAGTNELDDTTKMKYLAYGKVLHASTRRAGYDTNLVVANTLISMYGKCGSLVDAKSVFTSLPHPDVVSWNAILAAHVQQGDAAWALENVAQMYEGSAASPDVRTLVCSLEACGILAESEEGSDLLLDENQQHVKIQCLNMIKVLHGEAVRKGYTLNNVFVGNTLISMYGKCGSTLDARTVFEGLPHRNMVGWTAMISAYTLHGQGDRAVQLYGRMEEEGVVPDEMALVSILQACSVTGNLDVCRHIHRRFVLRGGTTTAAAADCDCVVANTLLHAYTRCGSMVDAEDVFNALPKPSVVSWSALIAGYARQGNCSRCLECCAQMQTAGVQPNEVTFLALLAACSHAGWVDKGVEYFESMTRDHGLAPGPEHYVGLVDLLGRAGEFTRLEHVLSTMPVKPDVAMLCCLLGACRKHREVMLGKQVFDSAVGLEPQNSAAYVLMSSIYSDAGLWERAKEVKSWRWIASAWKKPGQSWLLDEYERGARRFGVGGADEEMVEMVYDMLQQVSAG